MSSIFTKIIHGEIPCYKIYEDELCFAFLALDQLNLWHTLLIPKEEVGNVLDLSDELVTHITLIAKNILWPAIQRATGCVRIGGVVEWFGVPDHFHLHIVPLFQSGDLDSTRAKRESPEDMTLMAAKIQKELQ